MSSNSTAAPIMGAAASAVTVADHNNTSTKIYFFLRRDNDNGNNNNNNRADDVSQATAEDEELVREMRLSIYKLEDEVKKDLMEAISKVPHLVEWESDPLLFLKREDFDSDLAAKRLANYWFYRKDFFGEDRAFLPLHILGGPQCAMTDEDIEYFKRGTNIFLPNRQSDGEAVVLLHKAPQRNGLKTSIRKRIMFYAFQVAMENSKAATTGMQTVVLLDYIAYDPISQLLATLVGNAFPVRLQNHVFLSPSSATTFAGFLAHYAAIIFRIGGYLAMKTKLYAMRTTKERLDKLLELGFDKDGIPSVLGGSWDQDACQRLLQQRMHVERQRYLFPYNVPSTQRQVILQPPPRPQPQNAATTGNAASISHQSLTQSPVQPVAGAAFPGNVAGTGMPPPPPPPPSGHARMPVPPVLQQAVVQPLDAYSVRGLSRGSMAENPSSLERTLASFWDALALTPNKDAYLEALRKAPQVVQTETDPLRFIRVENYDPWKAASRLVKYWNVRKELFGPQRAFLPLKQTRGGAVTSDDILSAQIGLLAVLPCDAAGRQVVAFDRGRTFKGGGQAAVNAELRTMFYIGSVLAEQEMNQIEGIVSVFFVVSPHRVIDFLPNAVQRWIELYKCMPLKMKACHLISNPPKVKRSVRAERIIAYAAEMAQATLDERAILHMGDSEADILEKLEAFGLCKEGLPAMAGGRWNYEDFKKWIRSRALEEEAKDRLAQANARSEALSTAAADSASAVSNMEQSEDKLYRKRRKNVIISRQKRERRRAEELELRDQHLSLTSENDRLRRENRQFEALLADARRKMVGL